MSTLSNVKSRRGGEDPLALDLHPTPSSGKQIEQKGVSVEYVEDENKKWFVLRATYNRVQQAYDFMISENESAYLPMRFAEKIVNGKKKRILKPLIPNILFVYTMRERVEQFVKNTPELYFLTFYYNHFEQEYEGKNTPLTVGFQEMMNFIRLTCIDNKHIMLVDSKQCRYKSGDIVRVVSGDFAGIEGRVARVAGQQRVVVEIEGVCTIVTAYIPSAFLEIKVRY